MMIEQRHTSTTSMFEINFLTGSDTQYGLETSQLHDDIDVSLLLSL